MNKAKRMAAGLLCLLLCLTAFGGMSVSAADAATFTVDTVGAAPGDTVTVNVSVSAVDAVAGIGIYLSYDGDALECVGATKEGIISRMEMNNANFAPAGHPHEVWLTGMSLNGVSGEGVIMTMTFRVKETASAGFYAIEPTSKRQELYKADANQTALTVSFVSGGVNVTGAQSGGTEAPLTTTKGGAEAPLTTTKGDTPPADTTTKAGETTQKTATAPSDAAKTTAPVITTDGGAIVVTDPAGEIVTRENGAAVTVQPSLTVTRADGTVETQANGDLLVVPGAALVLSGGTVNPGGTVKVCLSVSAVSEIANMSITLSYDTDHMAFLSGEFVGFVKESMGMTSIAASTPEAYDQNVGDQIVLTMGNPTPVAGSGVIAELTFRVFSDTPAGKYSVRFSKEPQLITPMAALIPVETVAGSVQVEGEAVGDFKKSEVAKDGLPAWSYVLIALGAILIVGAIVAWCVLKKGKQPAAAPTAAPAAPKRPLARDVSGEELTETQETSPSDDAEDEDDV